MKTKKLMVAAAIVAGLALLSPPEASAFWGQGKLRKAGNAVKKAAGKTKNGAVWVMEKAKEGAEQTMNKNKEGK